MKPWVAHCRRRMERHQRRLKKVQRDMIAGIKGKDDKDKEKRARMTMTRTKHIPNWAEGELCWQKVQGAMGL